WMGKPVGSQDLGAGERWKMKTREELRKEAEAVKGTEKEIEGLIPVKARISPNLQIVYSLRFSEEEMSFIRNAAKRRGIKMSDLIREGAMEAAARAQEGPSPRDEALKEARELVGAAARALEKLARG